MSGSPQETTNIHGSYNLITSRGGELPKYCINGVPLNLNDIYVRQTFSSGGTINSTTNLVLSTGTHTLVMPLVNNAPLKVKSISGTITLDPGTNTIENSDTVSTTVMRELALEGTVWLEL